MISYEKKYLKYKKKYLDLKAQQGGMLSIPKKNEFNITSDNNEKFFIVINKIANWFIYSDNLNMSIILQYYIFNKNEEIDKIINMYKKLCITNNEKTCMTDIENYIIQNKLIHANIKSELNFLLNFYDNLQIFNECKKTKNCKLVDFELIFNSTIKEINKRNKLKLKLNCQKENEKTISLSCINSPIYLNKYNDCKEDNKCKKDNNCNCNISKFTASIPDNC